MRQIAIEIAGIPITLQCNRALVIDQLASRYREYLAAKKTGLKLSINLLGITGNPLFHEALPRFELNQIRLSGESFEGVIDLNEDSAILAINSSHPCEDTEYFLRVICAFTVFQRGGLLLHAAGIIREGKAILFLGHSGSGKSTATRLSIGYSILSDDMIILMPQDGQWQAASTPFWNPDFPACSPSQAPLGGLLFLRKAGEISLKRLPRAIAIAEMITNIPLVTLDPNRNEATFDRCQAILSTIPAYRLSFLRDVNFWPTLESRSNFVEHSK